MKENLLGWRGCLLFATLLLGCQKLTGGNVQSFFPFQEGAKWQYAQRDLISGRPQETFELFFRGVQQLKELKREIFIIDEVVPQGTSPTGYFIQDGFLMKVFGLAYEQGKVVWKGEQIRYNLGFAPGNIEKFLPETLTVGAQWHNRTPVLNAIVEANSQVVGREGVEVPAGRYPDCFRIESNLKVYPVQPDGNTDPEDVATFSSSDWYATGVGLVKSQVRQEGKDTGEILLLRYEEG